MKNNKGFTLIELLIVISILLISAISCIIAFNTIDNDTKEENMQNIYKQVQTSAMIYIDLNDKYRNEFVSNKKIYIPYMTLLSENYITEDIDSKINDDKGNLYIKIAITDKDYVDSCILKKEDKFKCFRDSNGNKFEENKIDGKDC